MQVRVLLGDIKQAAGPDQANTVLCTALTDRNKQRIVDMLNGLCTSPIMTQAVRSNFMSYTSAALLYLCCTCFGQRQQHTYCLFSTADANHSSPVKKMLGPVPSAVRQAAIRGHAQVLKQTGKVNEAAAMLQSVVDEQDESKMQHGLFADFGSLLQAQGNFKVGLPRCFPHVGAH